LLRISFWLIAYWVTLILRTRIFRCVNFVPRGVVGVADHKAWAGELAAQATIMVTHRCSGGVGDRSSLRCGGGCGLWLRSAKQEIGMCLGARTGGSRSCGCLVFSGATVVFARDKNLSYREGDVLDSGTGFSILCCADRTLGVAFCGGWLRVQ